MQIHTVVGNEVGNSRRLMLEVIKRKGTSIFSLQLFIFQFFTFYSTSGKENIAPGVNTSALGPPSRVECCQRTLRTEAGAPTATTPALSDIYLPLSVHMSCSLHVFSSCA